MNVEDGVILCLELRVTLGSQGFPFRQSKTVNELNRWPVQRDP